ncbi:MAG: SpoIIE family protein phosphatase [Bacteroidia bacterium]|nr:SpoIIE family protein phosphatase [Bacteroidia bacterium]
MSKALRITALICLLFILKSSYSQFNNFKKWSVKNGLLQSDIYDIKQDSRGYLWLASGGGVSVFNGIKFKHFTKKDGLSGNVVRCLFEDSEGRMWFGTNEGVCFYNGLKFFNLNNKNFKGASALCFAEDKNKNIYIGTDDGGLNIIKFNEDSIEVKNLNESNGLSNNPIFDIAIDSNKNIWLATYGGGLNILNNNSGNYSCKIIKGFGKLNSDLLFSVEIYNDDIYLGTQDAGLIIFSIKNLLNENYNSPKIYNTKNGLNSNDVWDILITKDKKVWLASLENGVSRLEKNGSDFINTGFTKNNGLSDNQVLSLYEDKQENVWIGTNGNGLNLLLGEYFSHYSKADGLPSNKIQSIQQDSAKNYWLGSTDGGLTQLTFTNNTLASKNFVDEKGLTNFISCVALGNKNNKNIWFGTIGNGIVRFKDSKFTNYTENDGLVNNRIYSIYVDTKGIVWAGTSDGISRYDGVKFLSTSTEKLMMQNEGVKTIVEDNKNTIWFGTSGGVVRYQGKEVIRTFDEVEGLKSKDVNSLASCVNGDVYIGTNTGGLFKYNPLKNDTNAIEFVANDSILLSNSIRSLKFIDDYTLVAGMLNGFDKISFDKNFKIIKVKHYTEGQGFLGVECNDNALFLDTEKNVWFGTVNGITKYSPSLDNKQTTTPEVFITDIQLFFKDVDWSTKNTSQKNWFNIPTTLTLPYFENHLTFKFHTNNLSNPESILYKFKLEGRDKNWSPPRKNSEETFSGLEPGDYTFMVTSQNESGLWSEPAKFSFTITPPWYRTKLFYATVIILLILLIYGYIKWREKKLVKEKEVLEVIVKERTHEVEVQKEHLAEINKEITDSINYAQGIQAAMLPPISDINAAWKDVFVFFQPKDIVSGDFYWFQRINKDEFLIACADCTGHGVPGGFMSMICSDKLHDSAKETNEPAQILSKTNNAVKISLRQHAEIEGKNKDGMEVCLIRVNTATQQVSYAGANRLLWVIDGETKELTEIKPTKASIASFTEFDFEYQQTNLNLKKGDLLYTTSDGYPDQFGGQDGKKYMSKNLKNLIIQNCHLPMDEQMQFFKNDINTWMANCEQVDDLLLIGIRL